MTSQQIHLNKNHQPNEKLLRATFMFYLKQTNQRSFCIVNMFCKNPRNRISCSMELISPNAIFSCWKIIRQTVFWLCRTKTSRFKVEKFFPRSFSIFISFALFDSTYFFFFHWLEAWNWKQGNIFHKTFVCDIAIRADSSSEMETWRPFTQIFFRIIKKKTTGFAFFPLVLSLGSVSGFDSVAIIIRNRALSKLETMTPKVALLNGQRQIAWIQILSHCEYRILNSSKSMNFRLIEFVYYDTSRFVDLFQASSSHFAICSTSYICHMIIVSNL